MVQKSKRKCLDFYFHIYTMLILILTLLFNKIVTLLDIITIDVRQKSFQGRICCSIFLE